MHLKDLATQYMHSAKCSVPDWMLGAFRRRSISFADGLSDIDTRVFWLQSRGLTIDLRLPRQDQQVDFRLKDGDADDELALYQQANLEGWYAHTVWQDNLLSWREGRSYQLHNRWPEPAQLQRVGNCMMESAPSGAYVEDWRLLNAHQTGLLVGLELEQERDLVSGVTTPRKGALIINGDYAGLVVGRKEAVEQQISKESDPTLHHALARHHQRREDLLDFYTEVAVGDPMSGYVIQHSLNAAREGEPLLPMTGFVLTEREGYIIQRLARHGRMIEWMWRIDTFEHDFVYTPQTALKDPRAAAWRQQESSTLERYAKIIS